MGKGHELIFFQIRYMNGQQVHEKMLNITNHQGNVNQIHNDQNHLTSVRMAIIKKTRENRSW